MNVIFAKLIMYYLAGHMVIPKNIIINYYLDDYSMNLNINPNILLFSAIILAGLVVKVLSCGIYYFKIMDTIKFKSFKEFKYPEIGSLKKII